MFNLKPRRKTSHKGENGVVLVVGGSEDYTGAPALVGMGALAVLRAGADLVTVASPEKVAWSINCIAPDLITKKIKCANFTRKNTNEIMALVKKADVVGIGNGISFTQGAKEFMQDVVKKVVCLRKPLVIDAAALRVIKLQDVENAVLLPHAKELEALLNNSRLEESEIRNNIETNVLVKKGHPLTTIFCRKKTASIKSGNAGMTHGGTGDVLAGITAGLIAQGNDLFTSAQAACYVNGKTADVLYKKMGFGYLASDMVRTIPFVLKKFQWQV
ncbi:MAG: NAD(P)H-hydrate dehydratase [Candidatus Aenigmarchaeota archaeon]|nr:NAD(P)H-hydrate dehydratase [Candidatus Aenigmarchaeota archaeon]